MGARAFLRDLISIAFSIVVLKAWLLDESITFSSVILAIIVFGISLWFLLEKIGVL